MIKIGHAHRARKKKKVYHNGTLGSTREQSMTNAGDETLLLSDTSRNHEWSARFKMDLSSGTGKQCAKLHV